MALPVYMPRYVCPWINSRKGRLFGLGDEAVQCTLEADNWILQRKNELSEEFRLTATAVQRGADTSSLWTPNGKYEGFFYIQKTAQPNGKPPTYGADWCPLWMKEGEIYPRNCIVTEYWHDGRVKAEYPAATKLKFVHFHPTYTFTKSNITLANVIELNWEGEENYFYSQDYGLCGWLNLRTGAGSYLGALNGAIRAPYPHPIARPLALRPPTAYPSPAQPIPPKPPQPEFPTLLMEAEREQLDEMITHNIAIGDILDEADMEAPVSPPGIESFFLYTPFRNNLVTSRFNAPRNYSFAPTRKQLHEGEDSVDGSDVGGDPLVYCGRAGIVVKVGFDARGYGKYCLIDFGNGWSAWYAHFTRIDVRQGDHVQAKQPLGEIGASGMATGEHCHLTLCNSNFGLDNYVVANVVNPALYLRAWN